METNTDITLVLLVGCCCWRCQKRAYILQENQVTCSRCRGKYERIRLSALRSEYRNFLVNVKLWMVKKWICSVGHGLSCLYVCACQCGLFFVVVKYIVFSMNVFKNRDNYPAIIASICQGRNEHIFSFTKDFCQVPAPL